MATLFGMDCNRITTMFLVVIWSRFSTCVITDVQLVGDPDSNKGTVEIKIDNGTWETTCGTNIDIIDVIVICRQLGFKGANRAIQETPYGQNSAPKHGLSCDKNDSDLSECSSVMGCSTSDKAGAASCHGEGYLGCFVDMASDRVLSGESLLNLSMMTIPYCIQFCQGSTAANYVYAGVENGNECYCGETSDNYTKHEKKSDYQCHVACSGDPTESCGGVGNTAVFNITETIETTPTIGSTWSTDGIQEVSPHTEVMTYQPSSDMTSGHSPRDELNSSPLTTTFSPTPQQYCNSSYFGAVVGEGVVIIILSVLLILSVIYIIRIRKMMKDPNKDQKKQQVDLVQSSSSPEKDTGFYHDIQDVKKSDISATSDGDVHYSSQIYEHKRANELDPDDTSAPNHSYMI